MKKKLHKGNPITELVKGSMEYTRNLISQAFRSQFPSSYESLYLDIIDTFADFIIVSEYGSSSTLKNDEYWKVTYAKNGETYTFAPRDQWEVVELAYQPQSKVTESKKKKGQRIEERVNASVSLLEREEGKPRRIKIDGAIQAGVVNGNGRRYPKSVIEAAVAELSSHLNESAGQGRAIQVLGEAEHPSDKGGRPNLLETVTKWEDVTFDGTNADISGRILETSKGKDILTLMEGGVMPGVSLRGYGEGKTIKEGSDKIFEVSELHITGFDLVLEPSFENAAQWTESQNQSSMEDDMDLLEQLKKLLAEHPELFNKGMTEAQLEALGEKQLKKLDESLRGALGIDANANIIEAVKANAEKARKFDEGQKQADINKAIAEATKDLKYGEKMNKIFVESFQGMQFADANAVKAFAESQHKQFGTLAAAGVLKGMGWDESKKSIKMSDVLERETGTPSFARAAYELTEAIRKVENNPKSAIEMRAQSAAAVYTQKLLERFDTLYQKQLMHEAQMFEEAELTTDLNLPYSVSRAVIAEAFPNLVAANIFDVGTIDTSPTKLFYETTTGESGYAATVSDEVVTGGAEEVWYALAHGRITPGTVVVTSNPAGTTYVEGTDFVINYADGKIKFLSGGSINANDVLVDYGYSSIRNGEMQPIERVKTTLASKTIEAAADRLADAISREAIVFSRSQLGWDAVARTMANLVRQMGRKVDQGLLYMAFSAVMSIANNSTPAWARDTTQDAYAELYRLLGNAAVIVAKRFYEPTFYLASITNTDDLSNWEGFKRDGFPQTLINAAGFVGMVKNRPVFASTEFPDSLWIVGNRELVQHRVLQPTQIKGPFPVYATANDTTRLVAAEQYYAEEFNATESLVPEKGAYVPVTEDAGS